MIMTFGLASGNDGWVGNISIFEMVCTFEEVLLF